MTVYVDDMQRPARVGRIQDYWSHLVADTTDELEAMARRLRLSRHWCQHRGRPREHYDLVEGKRLRALELGAVPIVYGKETANLTLAKARGQVFDLAGFRDGTWVLAPRADHRSPAGEVL